MLQPWRLKLREADEAFLGGRLEEAGSLLCQNELREFLPAKQLLAKVAAPMIERAERRAAGGQSSAGWRDLEAARAWGANPEAVTALRQAFIDRRLAEAEAYLAAGEPAAAVSRLDDLARRGDAGRQTRLLRDAAARVLAAQRLCRRGEFSQAEENLAAAATLAQNIPALDDARKACRVKAAECRRLNERLHEAVASENWTQALAGADALLELCPEHEPARDARRRAWAAVGMRCGDSLRQRLPLAPKGKAAAGLNGHLMADRLPPNKQPPPDAVAAPGYLLLDSRFLLWVDGVGGYLVCPSDEVVLGQPVPGSQVDIPILGDISRRHARIRRDGEGYLIDPLRSVRLDGRPIERATTLADGNLIQLGESIRLRFRRPHALSRTARLEFVSHHRTQPSADAILLAAESCVLGPGANCHVVCRDWPHDVVLYRQADGWHCRAPGRFEIDGAPTTDRGPIGARSRIAADDFSLSLETI
jgi:hypothetical protein